MVFIKNCRLGGCCFVFKEESESLKAKSSAWTSAILAVFPTGTDRWTESHPRPRWRGPSWGSGAYRVLAEMGAISDTGGQNKVDGMCTMVETLARQIQPFIGEAERKGALWPALWNTGPQGHTGHPHTTLPSSLLGTRADKNTGMADCESGERAG